MAIGRTISSTRVKGQCGFIHVFYNGKRQQLFSDVQSETWKDFRALNRGDLIEYDGEFFTTRTGENTVRLSHLNVTRKCELSLPDQMHGVSLATARENPYLNLLSEITSVDGATPYRDALILKAKVLKSIREYLDSRGYIEVQTPILVKSGFGCDAKPFKTEDGQFLRIAPELELKKLIVGGFDKIYEIGKNFRNEGLSQRHNPEFTMLEFYAAGNWQNGVDTLTELLKFVVTSIFETGEVNNIDWSQCHLTTNDFIEDQLIQPTFVFPKEDSPLAKHDANGRAERVELYAGGMEIANLYSEQDDWREQLKAFEAQGYVDESYIDALKRGLPQTVGVGLGIERFLMLLTGRNIKEII